VASFYPEPNTTTSFKGFRKKLSPPVVIYADIEAVLENYRTCLNSSSTSSTTKVQKHTSYPTRETVPLMEFINKFLNSISAMLRLAPATLTLPLFKILPLPFPFTSRAALDRPAKINKPIPFEA